MAGMSTACLKGHTKQDKGNQTFSKDLSKFAQIKIHMSDLFGFFNGC